MYFIHTHKILYCVLILCVMINKSCNKGGILKVFDQDISDLYSPQDDVEIIDAQSFKHEIYDNRRAWVVEFYSSWCGFCQRFAPSWKAFATDVKRWKDLVGIGAVNCARDINTPICREFEIMAYPTIKYFYEDYKAGPKNFGKNIAVGTHVHEHIQGVLNAIKIEITEGRAKQFPNILPYEENDLRGLLKPGSTYTFLIMQDHRDYIGPEVIMDLHKIKNCNIRYAFSNNTVLVNKFNIKSFPKLILIEKDKTFQILKANGERKAYKTAIEQYVQPKNTFNENNIHSLESHSQISNEVDFIANREKLALKDRIKKMGDVVFQMDLETTLRYSLRHEIGIVKEITDKKLQALKLYLNVLSKYFPFGRNGRLFLQELKDFVWYKSMVKGNDIVEMLVNAESEDQHIFSSPPQWLGCKGSSPLYRGYPCGLWKMFHYLTVNAADYKRGIQNSHHPIVLNSMHEYIKHFFGCADCSQHFQDMSKRREIFNVTSWDDSILWLWRAHNEVNKRLSGDQTDDPEYPKYQFPSKTNCPRCYNKDDSWNQPEVLQYLKHMYSSINVRYIGSDTRVLHLGLDGTSNYKSETGLFKTVDTAMCFILYLASFILILIVIYMFLRRGYKKKVYQHDLLGKV